MGTRPSRWARISSWMMEVLFRKNTCSIAIVSTSPMSVRRSPFASAGPQPRISKSSTSPSALVTLSAKFSLNSSIVSPL